MKKSSRSVLIIGALLVSKGIYASAEPIKPDAVTRQEIPQPLNTATMDDYLLDMARAAKVNMLADATDFPAQSLVKAYPSTSGAIAGVQGPRRANWNKSLINVMGDFVAQKKLSTLRTEARTFLFWNEPDPSELLYMQFAVTKATEAARFAEAVAAAKAEGVPEADIIRGEVPEERLRTLLIDYLREEHGWTGTVAERNEKVNIQTRLEDLPPALRALVLLDARQQRIGFRSVQDLSDEFWKTADVRLHTKTTNGATTLNIIYPVEDENGQIFRTSDTPFTALDDAAIPVAPEPVGEAPVGEAPVGEAPVGEAPVGEAPEFVPAGEANRDLGTLADAYLGLSDEVSNSALDADPALQNAIALSVKRLPLREVLARLQEQSGVKFVEGEAAPAAKLLSASVEKMPLSKFMAMLSRLYGVTWVKAGVAYTMSGNARGELHLKLLQVGDPTRYRFRFNFYTRADRENEKAALGRAIAEQVGLPALRMPQGVAISALPQPLQKRFRTALVEPGAEGSSMDLFKSNRRLAEALAQKRLMLRFGRGIDNKYVGWSYQESPDKLRFSLQSDDGKIVTPIFTSFALYVAKPGEQNKRPPSRRR